MPISFHVGDAHEIRIGDRQRAWPDAKVELARSPIGTAVKAGARQPEAVAALFEFLFSAAAAQVIGKAGLAPVTPR